MKEAYDFYAYWNGPQVADLWNTIALITSTEDYRTLLLCVTVFGFIAVMIGAAVRNRGMDALTWFAATVVLFGILFVPRVAINVKDVRSGAAQVVANVPIGIGWPASVVSRVSWWMTQAFETAFQDVDAASYTRFGVAFPQRVVTSVLAVKPMTDTGRVTLVNFAERCIVPEILDHPMKRQALLKAPDIYALINSDGWVNPARRVMINGQVVTCKAALGMLTEALRVHEIPALEGMLGATLSQSATDVMSGAVIAAIPNAEALMLGVSRSLHESLRQSLLMSVIPDATMTTAAKAGQAPMTAGVALARAQGNLASEINYRTLSDMAKSALPKLRNLLEFIVIGLFPIVFLLMIGLGTSGIIVIRAYFTLLISVGLWAPITAIINYLTIHVDAEPMNRLVDAAGGVTLAAATMIREGGATSQAMAGSLMWLVPVLAYAVAKGSDMALTSMASSVLNPAASAAQAQGSAIAMGNVSAGNASLGNVSANNVGTNKTDASSLYGSQDLHRANIASGQWQASRGTGMVTAMSVAESNLGVTSAGQMSTSVTRADTTGTVETKGFTSSHVQGESTSLSNNQSTTSSVVRNTGWSNNESSEKDHRNTENVESGSAISYGTSSQFNSSGQANESFQYVSGVSTFGSLQMANPNNANTAMGMNSSAPQPEQLNTGIDTTNALSQLANNPSVKPMSVTNEGKTVDVGNVRNLSMIGRFPVGAQATTAGTKNDSASVGHGSSSTTSIRDTSSATTTDRNGTMISKGHSSNASLNDTDGSTLSKNNADSTTQNLQHQNSNQNTSTFSTNNGSSLNTGIQMNTALRDIAIKKYGDPSSALDSLNFDNSARMELAKSFESQVNNSDFLNSKHLEVTPKTLPTLNGTKSSELQNQHQIERQAVTATYDHSASLRNNEAKEMIKNQGIIPMSAPDREAAYLEHGLILASTSSFIKDNMSISSVVSRSFGFGLNYKSGNEIYESLKNEASHNEELRTLLIDLGKNGNLEKYNKR